MQVIDADGTVEYYTRPDWLPKVVPRCLDLTRLSALLFDLNPSDSYWPWEQLQLHQMDVFTAFLHGELTDKVYMRHPEGFIEPQKEHLVCHLKQSIYGLKQSPCCCNHALDNRLKEMGFKQIPSDPCMYTLI